MLPYISLYHQNACSCGLASYMGTGKCPKISSQHFSHLLSKVMVDWLQAPLCAPSLSLSLRAATSEKAAHSSCCCSLRPRGDGEREREVPSMFTQEPASFSDRKHFVQECCQMAKFGCLQPGAIQGKEGITLCSVA